MKLSRTLLCLFTATLVWGADQNAQKSAKTTPPAPAQAVTIPPQAEKMDENTYRHTDGEGKTWIYRKSPFGLVKSLETPKRADAVPASPGKEEVKVTAVEKGDSIQFERPGPFGAYRWTKKKTELDAVEKDIWERQRTRAGQN